MYIFLGQIPTIFHSKFKFEKKKKIVVYANLKKKCTFSKFVIKKYKKHVTGLKLIMYTHT
jgi:hypothetical protein